MIHVQFSQEKLPTKTRAATKTKTHGEGTEIGETPTGSVRTKVELEKYPTI